MANFDLFLNKLLRLEGGYVNHKNDKGKCTCKGVTINTFRKYYGAGLDCDDLKNITETQVSNIYKTGYWDACWADKIHNSQIANLLVDFAVNSGPKTAIKGIQRLLKVSVDGIMGPETIGAINAHSDPFKLHSELMQERVNLYNNKVESDPSQKVFLNGWMNRLKEYEWKD